MQDADKPTTRYSLRSPDGSLTHDATALLGPGCQRKLEAGCTYSTERLQEIAHRPLKELQGVRKWRFGVEHSPVQVASETHNQQVG